MGATASHPSPRDEMPLHVRISDYSNLVRVPLLHRETVRTFSFGGILWIITVEPKQFNEGLADRIHVWVDLHSRFRYKPDLVLQGIDISMEVLDVTGENTVFHEETNGMLESDRVLIMVLYRRELEASSCVRDDTFTLRCTLTKQQATWWRLFSKPNEPASLEPQVAMAGSNMLTIGSFYKLKATLRGGECTYSTHFAVGGCRWYFQFSPTGVISLVRASKGTAPTTAEFSFELEGVVNLESEKMTHTFNHANSRYFYRCRLEPSTSAMDDHLIVRCRLTIIMVERLSLPHATIAVEKIPRKIMVEKPSLPVDKIPQKITVEKPSLPPAAIRITATPHTESVQTPLLSAMYD
ncbi:unnamed protein product [Triticum turgidum subsp. durum]|uniref:MATH domain-containing protein n=1 Tax=Triticum turgidum subsp. durum TaxID=4567 RepID=A0A9R1S7M6_TRITD|nr:unnamed protein product [Triticum turgidum subsp. durum]